MCMLEMATSEYPYNECMGPAQIYKKVHPTKNKTYYAQILSILLHTQIEAQFVFIISTFYPEKAWLNFTVFWPNKLVKL